MSNRVNLGDHSDAVAFQLGNFANAKFVFDDVPCNSAEGFIQSLKFRDEEKQRAVCQLVGIEAKYAGKKAVKRIIREGTVFWKGEPAAFRSEQHRVWIAAGIREKFRQHFDSQFDLISTGDRELVHETGRPESRFTSLPANEFIFIMKTIRKDLIASAIRIFSDEEFALLFKSLANPASLLGKSYDAIEEAIRIEISVNEAARLALVKTSQRPFFADLLQTEHSTTLREIKQICGIFFQIRDELTKH